MRVPQSRSRRTTALAIIALVIYFAFYSWDRWGDREIALKLGEPWEDMRQRSSAKIGSAIPGHYWGRQTRSDASLRFADPQYGFITPPARFFTVTFESDETVSSVRMSPQIEPLLLDDALAVVLDLQDQWRKAGWKPFWENHFPSYVDTPQCRADLRDRRKVGTAYWRAGDKYQVMLVFARFKDDRHPDEERYLITLELAKFRGDYELGVDSQVPAERLFD